MSDYMTQEWLKNLKVGDNVFVRKGFEDSTLQVHVIERITPTGLVRVNNMLFRDGMKRHALYDSPHYLVEYSS